MAIDLSTAFMSIVTAVTTFVACYVISAVIRFTRMRRALERIPGPPRDNFLYGNAKLFFDKVTNKPSATVIYQVVPDLVNRYDGES